ncbi:MAG: membrane protein insertase YidC [Propionibacteriaceae bacterium]|nr:membrane protein insertase YidC [Propionibacteriaceae bacterium]
MSFLDWLLGTPLGWLLHGCYQITLSYGWAIILFALVVKAILFPLSLLAQHNAITMALLKPRLDDIKRRFEGNSALILDEQRRLYKENHYSAVKGSLPLLIQIPIVLGVIAVVYHPLRHILRLSAESITALVQQAASLLHTTPADLGLAGETRVMELVQSDPTTFQGVAPLADLSAIQGVDLSFFGFNLAEVPTWGSASMIWPVLSGLSALAMCLYQNRYYVLQKMAGRGSRWGMTAFMVAFSGYFALVLPGAFGLYWTAGNLLTILVVWLCNVIADPRKKVDYSVVVTKKRVSPEQRALKKATAAKSRVDVRRFHKAGPKQVMVYSEGSGYWKYFAGLVEALIAQSDVVVHYVTNDVNDQVFSHASEQLVPYCVSPRALIPFLMRLDVDIAVMTTPDLETYHLKRSLVRPDVEYVYVDHGMTSFHLTFREGALDHFDTIFCNGPNHITEVRQTEEAYSLPAKRLVNVGYPLLDQMLAGVEAQGGLVVNDPPIALIAPSWQPENLLEICLTPTVQPLLDAGFIVIIRPHPEFCKRFPDKVDAIRDQFRDAVADGRLQIETDFSSNSTVYNADVVVTDWSSIAQEFSYVTKKPSIFINTPMKIMNHNYTRIDAVPLDITLRDEIGVSIDVDDLATIGDVARGMVANPTTWAARIDEVVTTNLFHVGDSAQAGAAYLLASLAEKAHAKDLAAAEHADATGTATAEQLKLLEEESARIERGKITRMREQADDLESKAHAIRHQADELEKQYETAHA